MAASFKVNLVPRHYMVMAQMDEDGMFELITSLRRFVDEFEAPEATEMLLDALEQNFAGDLPQRIDVSLLPELGEGDDEEDGGAVAPVA